MNFKESLDFVNQHKIDILKVNIADQVETTYMNDLIEKYGFETICEKIEYAYKRSDGIQIWKIAFALSDLLEDGKSLEEISNSELLDKATYYD